MKKVILLLTLVILAGAIQAQSIWKPVPKDLFTKDATIYNEGGEVLLSLENASEWLWRFDGTVLIDELVWHKDTRQFVSVPLSAVGPAIGYKHYSALPDGTPYNDFGVSAAVLLGTNIYDPSLASAKLVVMVTVFQYIKFGGVYTLNVPADVGHFGIAIGAGINF
jgi:hypothetical protein